MRTIVVGDIHGCYEELLQLLAKVQLTEEDCLISLGDIVDRGVDSVKVYDFLKHRPNTIVLMGNHERKHLRQTLSYSQEIVKLQFGDRYEEFLTWVNGLPYYHETDQAIFVHAAVEDGIPIDQQKAEVLCGCTAGEKHLEKRYGKTYWSHLYTGAKPVIFGHHIVGNEPLILTVAKWQLPVMMAKPWGSYKWEKIQAICDDFKNSSNRELVDFMRAKQQWMNDLLSLAPKAIVKVEEKLAELISIHGADDFKKPASRFTYATLLYKANASHLTVQFLKETLPTPDKWLQVMNDLGVESN
ncbi:MAG TPA: serine/threonine protein phosphatase [Trichormus sp. M33_DOE_039]|nr:serine/threonine protein phosphatase [Trichormus sp. M33_DOE_039]